ncbi:DUF317 domain-containing protein [Streptomyces pseudovenezuelae]|uniref:DUF317 domain-containing protein n=1 Tax=Streptomyces pseudovenezuelae TaxID=67350 RepID=UPI00370FD392
MPPRQPSAVPYVLAAPGYLAGGGDWEQLTELLLRGHGWHNVSTIDQHTALASPDGRLHVVHDRRAGWTWNLRATGPAGHQWEALLGAYLPVEYVSDLVDAMRQPPTAARGWAVAPLLGAGWRPDGTGPASTAVSPDGLVRITGQPEHARTSGPWHAQCTVNGFCWWTAAFSPHTPLAVVTAFTRSLARDDPLPRMAIGTPLYGCGPHTRLARTAHGWADEQALFEARITDARTRRTTGSGSAAPVPKPARATAATRNR